MQRRVVADRDRDRQPLAALARGARGHGEMVVGGDADERARAAERAHARDRPVALARLGIARDDAAGGDVRPALVLEEAGDRQRARDRDRSSTTSWHGAVAGEHRLERRVQRRAADARRARARPRRAPRRSAPGSAAGSRPAAARSRARARRAPARGRARRGARPAQRRDRASRRSRPAGRRPRARASHGRSDWASATGTERARAHELDDLAALRPDRVARGHEGVALAHLLRAPVRCRARAARSRARRPPAPPPRGRARAAPRRPRPPRSGGARPAAPS